MSADDDSVSAGAQQEFLAFLELQRADYRRGLPERLIALEALWNSIARSDESEGDIAQLERQAHSLAGTGGTFGFFEFSSAAKALELAVGRLRACAAAPTMAQQSEIAALLDTMARSLPTG